MVSNPATDHSSGANAALPAEVTELFRRIAESPWNSRFFPMPGWCKKYPTMLTQEEMRLLAWLAQHSPVVGDIVDLGSFLGGSTVSLALGASRSRIRRKVHAYDVFEINETLAEQFLTKRGHSCDGLVAGNDALPVFKHFTNYFADLIDTRVGDVMDATWPNSPIAILFIDISKTTLINDHIVTEFFPHLQKGSLIVQQDFLLYQNPWLFPTMHKLRDSIEMLGHAEDYSAVFGVRSTPSSKELKSCLSTSTSTEETLEAIQYFRRLFRRTRQIEMIDALLASYQAAPNAKEAWNLPNVAGIPISFDLE
jgi:predicted O-methyltransferase YrrM